MNVKSLKVLCKEHGLHGYSKLKKSEVIEFLKSYSIPIPISQNTNETFGMSVEQWICDYFNLSYPINYFEHRTSPLHTDIQIKLSNTISKLNIKSFAGNFNCQYDFILNKKRTLSIKTNFNNFKVCPQNIGQTTKRKFQVHFKTILLSDIEIKEYIMRNIVVLTKEYLRNLFCCDYLLWIYKDKNIFHVDLFEKQSVLHLHMLDHMFSFTRSLDTWNESNTLRFNHQSIGEFQIHAHRNCVKFRFNMKKLKILLKLQSL